MKNNKKKKAFTIVELVIVIAVIAILAAVLIPTFASLIDKANRSADIQAVAQMNIALAAESAFDKPNEIDDVIEILSRAGYNSKERLVPISKDHSFCWYKEFNTILLAKDDTSGIPDVLVYPTDNDRMKTDFDRDKAPEMGQIFNLENFAGNGNDGNNGDDDGPGDDPGDNTNDNPGGNTIPVDNVTIKKDGAAVEAIELYIGDTVTLAATVAPSNATNPTVTWTPENEEVVTVEDGVVIAVGSGTTTITVASVENPEIKETCTVTVEPITNIVIRSSAILYLDETGDKTATLSAVFYGKDGEHVDIDYDSIDWEVVWSDQYSDVATVVKNADGTATVTGTNYGFATVKVTAGGKTVECKVTVADGLLYSAESRRDSIWEMKTTDSARYLYLDQNRDGEGDAGRTHRGDWYLECYPESVVHLDKYGEYCKVTPLNGGTAILCYEGIVTATGETYIACSTIVVEQNIPENAAEWLVRALTRGGKIKLDGDVTIPGSVAQLVAVSYDTELDLNGHTLTLAGDFYGINVFGSLSITNGNIITNRTSQLHAAPGGTLNLGSENTADKVTVTQKGGAAASLTNHRGTVTINNCEFKADNGTQNTLISNGTVSDSMKYKGIMTISNTTFVGDFEASTDGVGVINQCGTLTLENLTGLKYVENVNGKSWEYIEYVDHTYPDPLKANL